MSVEEVVHIRTALTSSMLGENIEKAINSLYQGEYQGGIGSEPMFRECGTIILGHIRRSFMTKSHGGTDEAGERWKPLSPKTIVYSRRSGSKTRPSESLNKQQSERWWSLYRQGLAMFKGDKSHAARRAWFVVKKEGATTLFDKYQHSNVSILYNTGKLFDSIVFDVERSGVLIRSDAEYASAHHYGIPGRLPQRRLWPEAGKWPALWWNEITQTIRGGVIKLILERMKDI
jgi:hypothetical protein